MTVLTILVIGTVAAFLLGQTAAATEFTKASCALGARVPLTKPQGLKTVVTMGSVELGDGLVQFLEFGLELFSLGFHCLQSLLVFRHVGKFDYWTAEWNGMGQLQRCSK